jgi:non-ribosomal peptide synthetase-like protein
MAETAFATDEVGFLHTRSRDGWLFVAPITVGERSFVGNGAILEAGTIVGRDSLVGLMTTAPLQGGDGTSWLGSPALELPRRSLCADPRLTTEPSRARITARGATELFRMGVPATVAVVLASLMFYALDSAAGHGLALMVLLAPVALLLAGVAAVAVTVAAKWALMGRYERGDHPLWSFFVWRDEIINSCQEQLAGAMLLHFALGTPLMSLYLRVMGAKVGRDVWCETLAITEFDMVDIGDGGVVNRHSVIETHLFHDRVLQIGTGKIGRGATLGVCSTMLPDTELGAGCSVGGRSIVMRGESLPAHTRWHGAPVVAV